MKRADKEQYLADYERARDRGEPYFPRYALRDLVVSLLLLIVLIGFAAWMGAPLDAKADPLSTDYVPRPEWYFFFIFQLLKYFSGETEVIGIVVIPTVAILFLALLPFMDRSTFRHFARRPIVTGTTAALLSGVLVLTLIAAVQAPPAADASDLTFEADSVNGGELFATYCSVCHGAFGEGAPNPSEPGDVIPPISTAEYLSSRSDQSIGAVIAQGLPDFGMAAFGIDHGGPLPLEAIDLIVGYIRSWEADPPVLLDIELAASGLSDNPEFLYPELCARCHGASGGGGSGPAFADVSWQQSRTDAQMFDSINLGHEATAMVAWGEVLTKTQIAGLVEFIRTFDEAVPEGVPRYDIDVLPIFQVRCAVCHGSSGGWDASTWDSAIHSGDHAPVVIPGDATSSILAQMMAGTHPDGILMPPDGKLPDALVQLVIDWINGGANQ